MDSELRTVVERCEGHALALTLLASLLRNRSLSLNTFLQDPTFFPLLLGDMAQNLLNHIYTQQLDQLHRDILLAFSVFREAVPLKAAQAVINYPTEAPRFQVRRALNMLLIQHLLEASNEERFKLHPIVASFVQDHFVEDDKLANQQALRAAHLRAAQYYREQATISPLLLEQRKRTSDVRSLIEAAWHLCHAYLWKEAFDLIVQEHLFANLIHWGEAAILLELCQLLLPLDKWNADQSQTALIYNYLGAVYVTLEQVEVEGGWRYCQYALKISRDIVDREGEGMALDNLGTLYFMAGQIDQALENYQKALVIREEIGDLDEIGMTLKNLGGVYYSLGRPERALDYYDQALEIRREVGDRRGEGTTLNNIALLYDELGQTDKAVAYYKQGLKFFREIGDREGEGRTLLNIGALYFKRHRYDVALACFQPDIFGGLQKNSSRDSNEWLDAVRSKVGKKRYDGLLTKVKAQASQIVEQALNTSLVSNSVFWRWKV